METSTPRKIVQLVFAAVTLWATGACASNERLTITQATDGTIAAAVNGIKPACPVFVFYRRPTVSISGAQISVFSLADIALAICLFTPPGTLIAPLPYKEVASIGILPDGAYALRWTAQVSPPISPDLDALAGFDVRSPFEVRGGALILGAPPAVPLLNTLLLFLLGLVLAVIAWIAGSPVHKRSQSRLFLLQLFHETPIA